MHVGAWRIVRTVHVGGRAGVFYRHACVIGLIASAEVGSKAYGVLTADGQEDDDVKRCDSNPPSLTPYRSDDLDRSRAVIQRSTDMLIA